MSLTLKKRKEQLIQTKLVSWIYITDVLSDHYNNKINKTSQLQKQIEKQCTSWKNPTTKEGKEHKEETLE